MTPGRTAVNTRVLCITVLVLTVLIFGANHYAARDELPQDPDYCKRCFCEVTLVAVAGSGSMVKNPKTKEEPSCSAVFRKGRYMGREMSGRSVQRLYSNDPDGRWDLDACSPVIYCDTTAEVKLECLAESGRAPHKGPPRKVEIVIWGAQKCPIKCENRGDDKVVDIKCNHWQRPKPTPPTPPPPGKKPPVKKSGPGMLLSMFSGSSWRGSSIISLFAPAIYSEATDDQEVDDQEAKEIITGSTRWRLIEGEAGIDEGLLTIAKGEAEVQSFCTGDTIRLVGPNVLSLPTCGGWKVDVSGRWQGAYARRLPDGKLESVDISLDLRKESGALKGELKTPDGTFNIVSARQNDTGLELQAEGIVAGKQRKILLNGKLTKGDIVFDGSESGISEKPYKLTGFVRRLYIADGALPSAILNQPYSFTLTAFAPEGQAITFRLADGRLPRGISFDVSSGTFTGTPTELGDFKLRVAAADAAGNVFEQAVGLSIKKMAITNRLLPDAFIGQSYSATLKVAGGQPPYRFSGFPPKGLTLDPNTGQISGIPTSSRHETSPFTVRDSQNNSESAEVSLQVRTTTILTSHFLPDATQGSPYRMQFKGVGNNIPTQWLMSGEAGVELLNSIGLTLNRLTGELSGTPTKPGSFRLSVGAVTTSVDQQYRNFTLTIK